VIPSFDDLTPGPSCLYACLRVRVDQDAGEPPTASSALQTLLAIARDFSPRVLRVSDVEVLLDVSGLGRLIGEPPAIERELRRAVIDAEIEADVAIAPTQTAARLLAAFAAGPELSCRPRFLNPARGLSASGDPSELTERSLSDLSVALLRPLETLPPAMNHRDRDRPYETFERWGIATLGDLAALPIAELSSRLGRRGVALHRLARGHDPRPFVPDADTPRYVSRLELEWPIEALEPLSFVFARLLDPLSAALERADRGAVAVRLDLRLADRRLHQRLLQLPAPMRDARVLRTLLLLDLESHPPSAPVDIVTIELDPAPARITQFSLLQRALPSPETLSTLIARLSALSGESRIGSPVLLDSHAPDAFRMERFAPETETETDAVGATGARGADGAGVLRRQRALVALRVSVTNGRPVHIAPSRRGIPSGAIVQAAGPWRSSGGWWIRAHCGLEGRGPLVPPKPLSGEGGWNRDGWDVALMSGVVCRIYQDRTTDCWFIEGIYD